MRATYTITERDFYRDAWAYTYPAPYGYPYGDALATVKRMALRQHLPQEDR